MSRLKSIAAYGVVILLMLWMAASAKAETRVEHRVRTAPVTWRWSSPLYQYTGGSYGVSYVNQLWPYAPRNRSRKIVFRAAVKYRVPFRLLLGVWGAESSFGKARSNFGLTGYFPGSGTSGSLQRDAELSARLFLRLYRGSSGRNPL